MRQALLLACAGASLSPQLSRADGLPTGGRYVAGAGTIATTGATTTITQGSRRGIIDWQGFSIGAGKTVQFDNTGGATLNRVTGGDLSQISGQLKATGSIYLINPSGVVVGAGGKVVTGGRFVASTRDVSNDGFMQGGALTFSGSSTGSVVNQGTIVSRSGDVVLIGASTANSGVIDAPNGTAALVAGDAVLMRDASGPDGITVAPAVGKGDVSTDGRIKAAAVALSSAGGNVYALAGNRGDLIQATGTTRINGQVWLSAPEGQTAVSGRVAAANVDGTGGSIVADGREVSLGETANLSASGSRGGTVLVGVSGAQGRDEANSTVIAANAVIRAAGEGPGSGGHIETSGRQLSMDAATIDAGRGGSWLVDPVDLTIDASAAGTIQTALNGGTNVTEATTATGSSGYGTTASGSGDIDVASSISWSSSASLTLSAYRSINIETGVSLSSGGAGSLVLHADNAATGTGTVIFNGTGNVQFTGSGNVDLFYHPAAYPTATSYGGNVTMASGRFTPYMTVDTAADLQNINSNLAGVYALNADIDASSIANFTPIAHGASTSDATQGFSGTLDGQGHTISHLTINDGSDLTAGLFSQTASAGAVRNLGLVNASVTSTKSGAAVGGLVGESYGTISSSYVTGAVSGNGLGNTVVGGLVGENDGNISNTYSSASVSGATTSSCNNCVWIGGLVGDNGLINYDTATISSSLATGSVSAAGSGTASIGGLTGENDAIVNNSYFDSQTTGQSGGDGFCNLCISEGVTGSTTAQLQSGSLPSGFSASAWTAPAGAYPQLAWQPLPGLLVSGRVYFGSSPLGSITVVGLANGASFGSTTTDAGGDYSLTAPAGTASVFTYLTGGTYKGNTFSDNGSTAFTGVDIYSGRLTLLNAGSSTYSGLLTALGGALGANTSSDFLFSLGGGNLSLNSGANFALESSVPITVDRDITATGTVLVQSAGDLTLGASTVISADGSGTPLTLTTGRTFTNSAGAGALAVTGGGRWLVYSQNPANDTVGSLGYDFKQYNASYGSTAVAQGTGNGLLYTQAPVLSASLTGTVHKTYDGSNTATVTSSNIAAANTLSGDTVTLSAAGATYADPNQGSSKSVTATGISVTATDGTGATVYGYQVNSSATGNVGSIDPATLAYTADTASRTYGSSNPAFTGTVSGFVGSDTVLSATTGTLSFTSLATTTSNVGNYAVNGSGLTANNGNYTFQQSGGNATALAIYPATLLYTANTASRTYGDSNPALSGRVTGFVNGDTQFTATTGTLSFLTPARSTSNAGSYAIDGSGLTTNGNYTLQQAAGNATALTIDPATLLYTANTASRTYGDANPVFSGTVTGFVNGDTQASATTGTLSFTSPATTASNVGNYAVNGSGLTANNGNYTFQQAGGNATALSIDPATLLYTANTASRTYGASNPALSGTVAGFVNGDTQFTATTGTLSFSTPARSTSNVGSYAIDGSGLTTNGNYTLQQAAGNSTALTIDPATLLYTANTASRTYGDSNPALSGTVTGFVNGDTQFTATTGTLSFLTPARSASNVGSYAIDGSGLTANNGNYTFQQAPANLTALTVNPATLLYAADAASRTYGDANPAFSGTVTGFVNGDTQASATTGTLSFTSPATTASNVGSYAVNGSGLTANNGNYTFQQSAGNATDLTIDPAPLLYTANTASRTYGASNPALSGTVTGFVNGDTQLTATTGTLSFSTPATSASNAGSYAVDGSGLTTTNGNYTLQQAAGNATALTIDPATLLYTANTASRTYGASNPALSGTVTGFVNGDTQSTATTGTLSFSTPATTASNVGSYAIDGSGLTTNGNYTLRQAAGNATALTIDPATLLYTANTAGRTYGAPNPALSGTVTGFVNGDTQLTATTGTLSFSTPATSASNAGSYAIDGSGLTANNGNYTFQQAPASLTALTVNPATLLYTADAASRTYGDANPAFSGTVTGFVNGDTLASVTTGTLAFDSAASSATNVGRYAIGGSGLSVTGGNYILGQAASNSTALTINPATLTYTADGANRTYGEVNPDFTGTVTGFVNGDTLPTATTGQLTFTSGATAASHAGHYEIDGTGLTANSGNYTFQQAPGNTTALTINPATLTYTADDISRMYGQSNPMLTGTVTGFVNGDSLAMTTSGTLTFASTATAASNVGHYSIDGSGLTVIGGDYVLRQADGNATALAINPATLTYVADSASRVYGDGNPGFTGTVTGFVNGDTLASATTGTLTFTSAADRTSDVGSYAIDGGGLTANHGNYAFSQAPANATSLSISPYQLTASLTGVVSKPFDRTDRATLSPENYVLSPTRNGDVVRLDAPPAGTYAVNTVGTDIPVTVSGLSLAGAKADDYVLASGTVTADIGEIRQAAPSSSSQSLFVSLVPGAGAAGLALLGDTSGLGPMPGILPVREPDSQDTIRVSLGLPVITEADQALMQPHRGRMLLISVPAPYVSSQLK